MSVVLSLGAIACACNVPVFRYALERWRPDAYRVTVFHRGPLTDADRQELRPLQEQAEEGLANVVVRVVDLARLDSSSDEAAADASLWAAQGHPPLPWMVVQYPRNLRMEVPVAAGPLDREAIARLADSPVRKELVRRLSEGETAVWLLLETDDQQKDAPAAALIEREIMKLEQTLELPELTSDPDDQLLAQTPLKVAFSMLKVSRNDPAERLLVAMLLASESDLAERADPMVFPVFGRGRALLPLIGPGITVQNIHESATFLVGACSCQVKELNPGFDLLLSADWDGLLAKAGVPLAAIVPAPAELPPAEPELVPIPRGGSPAPVAATAIPRGSERLSAPSNRGFWMLVCGATAIVVIVFAVQFAGWGREPSRRFRTQ